MAARFSGGRSIALKVPPHQYASTLSFYRDLLGLEQISGTDGDSVGFRFGENNLWVDSVATLSQAEIWLEIVTDDTAEAAKLMEKSGTVRCDEIEPLGGNFNGFWVSNSAGIIHLVDGASQSWS